MIIPQEIKQKPFEYIALGLTFLVGIFLYIIFDDHVLRLWIVCGVALSYFFWSLVHHYKRKDLQFSIIIEYVLIILIGIIFLSGTLF